MDLLSSIRKSGSRGGVNFSWDEVANSNHRENYLGHSLKAPVGRWQKGRDLNWYAKSDATPADSTETDEERSARERAEELRKIKEAEEDAIAKALGLPITPRNTTGANAVEVGGQRQLGPASMPPTEAPTGEGSRQRSRRHEESERRDRKRSRSRDRDRDRERRHGRHRENGDRDRRRDRSRDRSRDRHRGDERRHRRHRSGSPREDGKDRRQRDHNQERRRSRSRSREHRHRRS